MVIFIATRSGYEELRSLVLSGEYPVWVGAGVLNKSEMSSLRDAGVDLSNFIYSIDPGNENEVMGALDTIQEHNPGHKIWMEWLSRTEDN